MLITMKINDFDKRVMEILGKGGKSGQELATAGNFNYNTTRTHLKKLEKYKLIEMQQDKSWTLTEEGKKTLKDKEPAKPKEEDKYFEPDPYISRVRGFNILKEYCNTGYGDGQFGDIAIESIPDSVPEDRWLDVVSKVKRVYRVMLGLELLGRDEKINLEVMKNNPVLMLLAEGLVDDIKDLYPNEYPEENAFFENIKLKKLVSEHWFSVKFP